MQRFLEVRSTRLLGSAKSAVILLLFLLLSIRLTVASEADKNGTASQKDTAKFVGADVCKTCHEEIYKKHFELTPHFQTTL